MKDKLEVGMYVRTKNGTIAKLIGYCAYDENKIAIFTGIKLDEFLVTPQINKNTIIKASHNIIDLIEVGDYVNGLRVEEVNNNLNEHEGTCNCLDTYLWCVNDLGKFEEIVIFENDIKSIVTKEQFKSMEYRLGDDK